MLILNFKEIGNKLFSFRKRMGMTQAELAEAANISDRTYADIERGVVNMRVDTLLRICSALHITPDEILTDDTETPNALQNDLFMRLDTLSPKDKETALKLLNVYLRSLV